MSPRVKSATLLALPIILTLILSYGLQFTILANQDAFKNWLSGFGPFIILVYIILQIITIIIAPIGGLFLVVTMIALFGPGFALIMFYLVTTPTFLINFYLARKYGRPLVQKVVGKHAMEKMDEFIQDAGLPILIITRLLQGGNYDYLSYGWGLTKFPFKTFAIVNFLVGIPATFIGYLIFRNVENLTFAIAVFYIFMGISALVSISIHQKLRKRKKVKTE